MKPALALTALVALSQDPRQAPEERVTFPDDEEIHAWFRKGEFYRRIVGFLTARAHWAEAFRLVEERLGVRCADPSITVVFEETSDPRPARGGGRDGRGTITFNLRRLVEFLRKLERYERLKESGEIVRWVVPPARLEGVITHELAHVICGSGDEKWYTEGLASWAAGDPCVFYAFNRSGRRVERLDRRMTEEDAYARGMAFFAWLEIEHGRSKVHEFVERVARQGAQIREAAEKVSGQPWERVVLEERAWSDKYIGRFRDE